MFTNVQWPAITDWDAMYDNAPAIPKGHEWPQRWVDPAQTARETFLAAGRAKIGVKYGDRPRNRYDLFLPDDVPRGVVIFVHGGFWMGLDESYWSHFAQGPLAHGFAVAVPTYTLAPEARISEMTREIAQAISHAARDIAGPIHLCGHSAGGHLVTRMVVENGPLAPEVSGRIKQVLSVSGLHDLRPMLKYWRNKTLHLDLTEAVRESPALLAPQPGVRLTCWAGAMETPEFLRQNALLANIWRGLGSATSCVEEPMRHHFNILDGLTDPHHPMSLTLCAP
ncbi:alpha/beta hydrolase [Albirhodobacter sp. R86504]|uniref:alpha/beta hydrolase n=1 Tax=Albirhodobacter sp. R86504 TaxID=3093848 RepID=UPI0036705A67